MPKSIYDLVGMRHRGTEQLVSSMEAREPLKLIREPTNQYDPRAVQVWGRDTHLGYIKAVDAFFLSERMDDSKEPHWDAILVPGTWPRVEVDRVE